MSQQLTVPIVSSDLRRVVGVVVAMTYIDILPRQLTRSLRCVRHATTSILEQILLSLFLMSGAGR
jgi:hypothetical protein